MDLNVRLKPGTQDKELALIVRRLAEMGWSAMAWNQSVVGKAGQKYQVKPRGEVLLSASDIKSIKSLRCLVRNDVTLTSDEVDPIALAISGGKISFPHLVQYNRVTVTVDEVIDASTLTSTNESLREFDIVAAIPGDAKVFAYLCKVADIDVISLDFTRRVPFALNKKMVDAAVRRGVVFEIRYNPVFHSSSARKEIFAGTRHLIKILRGKHIILTSGVENVAQIRGVHEAINVGKIMNLNAEQALQATLHTCREVLRHGTARKNRFLPLEVITPEQFENIYREYEEVPNMKKRNTIDEELCEMYNPSKKKRKAQSDDGDSSDSDTNCVNESRVMVNNDESGDDDFLKL